MKKDHYFESLKRLSEPSIRSRFVDIMASFAVVLFGIAITLLIVGFTFGAWGVGVLKILGLI